MSQDEGIPTEFVIRGKRIAQDEYGFLSLTDMWQVAGENISKKPASWTRLPTTRVLLESVEVRFSHLIEKTHSKSAIYTKRGRGAATFAHHILALAFAEYLDGDLGIEVRLIAMRFWAGDVTVLDEFNKVRSEQHTEDGSRMMAREEIRRNNRDLNAIVYNTGARFKAQFAAFHNAGYRGLYNGEEEDEINARKNLKKDQRILDHMGFDELAANMFRTSMAQRRLRYGAPVETVPEACEIHQTMGESVRAFIAQVAGPMPEEMPNPGPISEARKRMKYHFKSLGKEK